MQINNYLNYIVSDPKKSLSQLQAFELFKLILTEQLNDLELGAILSALSTRTQSVDELIGFYNAMQNFLFENQKLIDINLNQFQHSPIVFSSYNGTFQQVNLLPLLIILLKQFDIPVILHGLTQSPNRIMSAEILISLGYQEVSDLNQIEENLLHDHLAIVPVKLFSPVFEKYLLLRWQLGIKHCLHKVIKLLTPFKHLHHSELRFISTSSAEYLQNFATASEELNINALIMPSTDGEAFANPQKRPQITWINEHQQILLFKNEASASRSKFEMPTECSVNSIVEWIQKVLNGLIPVPMPIVNQLASCVLASGYAKSIAEAKAVVTLKLNELTSHSVY